jgi:hypothetical protein
MPDDKPATERPARSQWTEGVHSRLDLLRVALEENTKATVAMSSRINSMFLIPLAGAAIGAATWALFAGRISEHSWLAVVFACLAEFFGKGVRNIVEGFLPWGKKASTAKPIAMIAFLVVCGTLFFAGCLGK